MLLKFGIIIRKDIGSREKVKVLLTKLFLHTVNVLTEAIFSCYFLHLGEYIDSLIFM